MSAGNVSGLGVLHVLPSVAASYGGPVQSVRAFAEAAATCATRVGIAAPRPGENDALALELSGDRIALQLFDGFGRGAFVASPSLWWWLRRAISGYDVVHIHTLLNPVTAVTAALCRRARVPYIVRPCGMLSEYSYAHRRRLLKQVYFRLVDRHVVGGAAAVHFTTDVEAAEAARRIPIDASRVFVIPPPFAGQAAPATGRDARGPVLFLARLNPVKSLDTLLSAWVRVQKAHPERRLVIAGDGERSYADALRKLADELGVTPSVRFAGHVSGAAKADLLATASMVVLPSKHENLSWTVLEAMASGVPLIVSPEVHLSSFIADRGLGRVVPREAEALAAAILDLAADRQIHAHCAVAGPAAVAKSFSFRRVAEDLCQMYARAS